MISLYCILGVIILLLVLILASLHNIEETIIFPPVRLESRPYRMDNISEIVSQPNEVELLISNGTNWTHHSWRPKGHKDIQEALNTPGLAIKMPGQEINLGKQ